MASQDTLWLKPDDGAEGRREVEENKESVENWPDEEGVDQDVDGVAVVCSIESKVLFKIEQSSRHYRWKEEMV